jgi:hypothetical protein
LTEQVDESDAKQQKLKLGEHWLPLVALSFLSAVAFGIALGAGFLADDSWQLQFAYRVMHGEPELLWQNFKASYLGIPNLDFYRPLLGFSYLLDYLIAGGSPFLYHATNFLLCTFSALLFYFLCLRLTASFGRGRSMQTAFAAAGLFLTSPLHVETVVWISGRADLLASCFYLASLLSYLKSFDFSEQRRSRIFLLLALCAYVLALLTKESVIGLPLLLAALPLILPQLIAAKKSYPAYLVQKLWPFILVAGIYLTVRYQALGTIIGGYAGDIDLALGESMLSRWLDPLTLWRLLFPLPVVLFRDGDLWIPLLGSVYAVILGLFITRLITQRFQPAHLGFLLLFFAQALLPLFRLWGLDSQLHNSRIYYFLSMPMALFLPWFVFVPRSADNPRAARLFLWLSPAVESVLLFVCSFAFFLQALLFSLVSFAIASNWVNAAEHVSKIKLACVKEMREQKKKILVLGLPKMIKGVQCILCDSTFRELFEPPFEKEALSNGLVTFDSHLVGPEEPINASRFKVLLAEGQCAGPYFVDKDDKLKLISYRAPGAAMQRPVPLQALEPKGVEAVLYPVQVAVKLSPKAPALEARMVNLKDGARGLALSNLSNGSGVQVDNLNLNPLDYDYLSFEALVKPSREAQAVYVSFAPDKNLPEPQIVSALSLEGMGNAAETKTEHSQNLSYSQGDELRWVKVRIRLSHVARWYEQSTINSLRIGFSNQDKLIVKDFSLLNDLKVAPLLTVANLTMRDGGEYAIDERCDKVAVQAFCAHLEGASRLFFQLSRRNVSFDNFLLSPVLVEGKDPVVAATFQAAGSQAGILIGREHFAQPGFYELRVIAQNDKNEVVGDYSDTVLLLKTCGGKGAPYYRAN